VLNNSNTSVKLNLNTGDAFENGIELQDQLSDKHISIEQQQIADLAIPAFGAMILA